MNYTVLTKFFDEPKIDEGEILRYSGCKTCNDDTLATLQACIKESRDKFTYSVCYCTLPVSTKDDASDICLLGDFELRSAALARLLSDCKGAVIFAATVGTGIDRLIKKHSVVSPTKALFMNAFGTERVEALCDVFCDSFDAPKTKRFSPGYSDLSLEYQRVVFDILKCEKNVGIYLTDSYLMTPSKSVTAIFGIR